MTERFLLLAAFVGAIALAGCGPLETDPAPAPDPEAPKAPPAPTWTLEVHAERSDAPATKGLEIDGEEETTKVLKSVWKNNEQVKVFLGSSCIGTLQATPDAQDPHHATLSGTVVSPNITPNVTRLTLLTPRETWDYTGQTGALLLSDDPTNSIEKKYHYTMASDVLVTGITNLFRITTENATFYNQQSIYRLSFLYDYQRWGEPIHDPINAAQVTISSSKKQLVRSQVPGGETTEGSISVQLPTATSNPFFVAIRNGNETESERLTFTVVDADGVTYRGAQDIPGPYLRNGTFVSIRNLHCTFRMEMVFSLDSVNSAL